MTTLKTKISSYALLIALTTSMTVPAVFAAPTLPENASATAVAASSKEKEVETTDSTTVTVPLKFSYTGTLVSPSGTPITSAHTFRFSIWSTGKSTSGDFKTGNAINTSANSYASYSETQTITPSSDGSFFAEVGSNTPLPQLNFATQKYLQVEVKAANEPDSSYIILDPDHDSTNAIDRKPLNSTPYAINAERVGNAKVGTKAGNIATLGDGGKFVVSQIPGGTNENTFVINADDSDGNTALQFGKTLAKTIRWDTTEGKFFVNDTLVVEKNLGVKGDIYADGKINGRDIAADGIALDTAVATVAKLTTQATDLTTKLNDTTTALTAATTRVTTLEGRADASDKEITAAQATIIKLTTDLATTNEAITTVQGYLSAAKKELADSIATVKADLATTNTEVADISSKLTAVTARVATAESTLTKLTTDLAALKVSADATAAALATAEATLAALGQTVSDLAKTQTATQAALTALTTKQTSDVTTITASINKLTESISTANTTINKLTADLATANTNIGALTTRMATAETTLANHTTSLAELTRKLTADENTLGTHTTDIAGLKNSITALQTSITSLSTKLDAINASVTALTTRVNSVEATAHTKNQDTGTNASAFVINTGDATGDTTLQFGKTLAKTIKWDAANSKFVINDTLIVEKNLGVKGSLFVDGTVDGRDVSNDGAKLDTAVTDLANVKSTINTLAVITRAILTWDFIPQISNKTRSASIGKATGYVMTRPGKIVAIGLSGNPTDRDSNGTFYITKNDDGIWNSADSMTTINFNATGTGDANNSAYISAPTAGVAGLSFAAGDVIRIYHSDRDQYGSRATVEIQYQ